MKRTLPILIGLVLTVVLSSNALAARCASRILKEGSTGGDVLKLQRFLDHTGRDTTADGEFGPATAESLMDFEQAEDRKVDGVATRPEQRLVRARAVGEPEVAAPVSDKATIGPRRPGRAPGLGTAGGRRRSSPRGTGSPPSPTSTAGPTGAGATPATTAPAP